MSAIHLLKINGGNYEMNIYIAGPMSGHRKFNQDAFLNAEQFLEDEYLSVNIFNPVRHDIDLYGPDFFEGCPNGTAEEAAKFGFDLRKSLGADLKWICENATHMYMLKGWEYSKGARVEHNLATALGLVILYEE